MNDEDLATGHPDRTARSDARRFSAASAPVIAVQGLTCAGRTGARLRDVSLTVHEGEWLAVFGPTACGKTSLLQALSGDLAPTSGEVMALGAPPSLAAARIHFVPEEPVAPGRVCVRDALLTRLGRRGHVPPAQRAARVAEGLEAVGIAELRDVPVRDLTHGQRLAMMLAAAIADDPALLLLDNATAALPEPVAARVFAYLDGRRAADGLTVVHATCSSHEAERADRVAILHGGQILVCEPPGQIIRRLAADRIIIEADNPEEVLRTARGVFDVEVEEDARQLRFSARDPVEMAAQVMRHPAGGASVVHVRYGTLWDAYARLLAQTNRT